MNMIAPSQAWSMLQRHANKDVKPLRLSELIRNHDTNNNNEDGVDPFVEVLHNSSDNNSQFIVDWSRQRTTSDTMNHLLRLSTAKEIRERIHDLAWGRLASGSKSSRQQTQQNKVSFSNNLGDTTSIYGEVEDEEEIGGSMHLSLRAPEGLVMHDPCSNNKKKNALDAIHKDLHKIQTLTESIRKGNVRGASGKPICDVLVICGDDNSVVTHSLEFVYQSLIQNEEGSIAASVDSSLLSVSKSGESMSSSTLHAMKNIVTTPFKSKSGSITSQTNNTYRKRKLKILTSTDDPTILRETLSEFSPSNTLVISLDLELAYEKDCKTATSIIRDWLVSDMMDTSNENRTKEAIVKKHMYIVTVNETLKKLNNANAFLLPRHSRCEQFSTFSAAGILPLSLIFGWDIISSFLKGAHDMDRHFVDTNPRHNLPFILALLDLWNDEFLHSRGRVVSAYPEQVSVMESKVLRGQGSNPTITGSHAIHSDQCMEFIMALQPGHDDRICSLLAHADTLAFGNTINNKRNDVSSLGSPQQPLIQRNDSMKSYSSTNQKESSGLASSGNQPSTLIFCKGDAFACGQLIAMTEHRTLLTAWLRGIDPFTNTEKSSLQVKQQRKEQLKTKLQHLQNGEELVEEDQVNSSTMTILKLIS